MCDVYFTLVSVNWTFLISESLHLYASGTYACYYQWMIYSQALSDGLIFCTRNKFFLYVEIAVCS